MLIINEKISSGDSLSFDDGFQLGRGVFETILVKEKPLFFEEHFARLLNGISVIGINNDVKRESLLEAIQKHQINHCVLKIIVTDKNTVITTRKNPYKKEDYDKGFGLKFSNIIKDENSKAVYIKSLARLDSTLEKEKAVAEGFDEAIFLNTKGYITEVCNSNVFFVKDDIIFTPSIECGLLNGIVRGFVIGGFEVNEGEYTADELLLADEVFLTNSVLGIMRVRSIEDRELSGFRIYNMVKNKYNLSLNVSC